MKTISFASILGLASLITAQQFPLPPPGKVWLGTWLDTADSAPGALDGDRPVLFNRRMGIKTSVFQYAQDLPVPAGQFPLPDEQIKNTGTDAILLMTLYPRPTPYNIPDADINALVQQLRRLTGAERRRIILRFGAEMNGNWNYWGQQPVDFKNLWIRLHRAVKSAVPSVAFCWAPSSSNGYPYGDKFPPRGSPNFNEMDTNKDGVIDARDDAYSPYYPGDEYVDWIGLSVYHYGSVYPWLDNVEARPGLFDELLNAGNFYQQYSVLKKKPFMIAEGAASFHLDTPRGPGVGELAMKRSFWRQWLTNATFYDTHPEIKMVNMFEFKKNEEQTLRDFRISTADEIRNAFLADFEAVKSRYQFATQIGPVVADGQSGPNGRSASSAIAIGASAFSILISIAALLV